MKTLQERQRRRGNKTQTRIATEIEPTIPDSKIQPTMMGSREQTLKDAINKRSIEVTNADGVNNLIDASILNGRRYASSKLVQNDNNQYQRGDSDRAKVQSSEKIFSSSLNIALTNANKSASSQRKIPKFEIPIDHESYFQEDGKFMFEGLVIGFPKPDVKILKNGFELNVNEYRLVWKNEQSFELSIFSEHWFQDSYLTLLAQNENGYAQTETILHPMQVGC